ncbi:MAG: L,D-transpeptidase family protein [Rhizobiales bacterium]|nr:L,D-transpeptidase family protein [Hyphomicrobiales bacterium]
MPILEHILVTAAPDRHVGTLRADGQQFDCALGRSGLVKNKREGDGGTPMGSFPLRELRYRADRLARPSSHLPLFEIAIDDGWCDAPTDAQYNRPVKLPYRARAEDMWRLDQQYNLVVPLGYNDDPVVAGLGSAIFFHVAKIEDGTLQPTEGCVALPQSQLLELLARCGPATLMHIG